jgi:phosphomannomutase
MFVDETGAFVQPDYLIPIVARAARRAARAGASSVVLHDVRTSRGVVETLREDGFAPVMVPVGHAFAKPKMRETGALCGGELAGHYYFGEFFGCDSGFLAVLHVLSELALARARGETFSSLVRPIVSRYANSGERNFTVGDKAAAIARAERAMAASFPPETGRSALDGVRVEFEDGWVNLRASNTEPYLRLLAEFRDPRVLEERLAVLTAAIGEPEKP